jgi:hypothetical protein
MTGRVKFPHAPNQSVSFELFVAAWKRLIERLDAEHGDDWRTLAIPRHNRAVSLERQVAEGRALSLDVLCRLLVDRPYRNTMHATKPFLRENPLFVEAAERVWHGTRLVNAVRLRQGPDSALGRWDELPPERQAELERDAMKLLQPLDVLIEHSPESSPARFRGLRVRQRNRQSEPVDRERRREYLTALMWQLEEKEFQPCWRRKPIGGPVHGWGQRLQAYFWPSPGTGYRKTAAMWQEFTDRARPPSERIEAGGRWTANERSEVVKLALDILAWGRVPQPPFGADTVESVFRSSLSGSAEGGAPMNSGWSKVAAFATAHHEGHPELYPQAIWDSRVSTSLVTRLDALLASDGVEDSQDLFPRVGFVPGRGGKREELPLRLWWPNTYRSWSGHLAGSELVRELRDLLNCSSIPPMPLPDGGEGPWTIMGVGNVLFMDGY